MEGRWKITRRLGRSEDGWHIADGPDPGPDSDGVPVVPCDEQAVERVAAELCRQRGWKWADQGNDMRVAFTSVAILALEAARGTG